jgi:DNA-binding NarL/FixJ family response regulator
MKILLVDDNRLMLEGLQNLLEVRHIDVVGVAFDGRESLVQARKLKPDVILMDIQMPVCDGLAATRLIKAEMPDAKIVILTTSTEDQNLFEAVKSGACGYLLKSIGAEELLEAMEQVQEGTPPFSPGLAAKLLKEFSRVTNQTGISSTGINGEAGKPPLRAGLNPRQVEVLKLVSEGLSYKEVGARLGLSPRTVRYHMTEIMDQLHLDNRAQVIAYAGEMGWKPNSSSK